MILTSLYILSQIPNYVDTIASLHPSHIAVGTPYDEEFIPILTAWVKAIRSKHLKVWFRGNFSGWEGWFGYLPLPSADSHHVLTANFIANHPDLFSDGDIFSPVPEPENGLIKDPRNSPDRGETYRQFLIDSYRNCNQAFSKIGKKVTCGYFSTNADIAKEIFTPDMVAKTGNVVVIDHYVKTPTQFALDIDELYRKFKVPIVIGEFGAPIPDLQGSMTEIQQAAYVGKMLEFLWHRRDYVKGINYWSFADGSTALFNPDFSPRQVTGVVKKYYQPGKLDGKILNPLAEPINEVAFMTDDQITLAESANNGNYSIPLPDGSYTISVKKPGYKPYTLALTVKAGVESAEDIILEPEKKDLWYLIRLIGKEYIDWLKSIILERKL